MKQAKIVVLFNHKGGVSKTTSTFNIGWKLAQLGKKVLLVDGDPQCNLTGLLLGVDRFEDYYSNPRSNKQNIKDGVAMAFEGKPEPIVAIDCPRPCPELDLYLLPGHMDLAEFEPALSLSLNSNNAITTLQNLPGAFYRLFQLCSEKYEIDYVLIDMNPGLSSLNQTFFMMCDGFVVPTNPDVFSIMALRTIKKVLPRWKSWVSNFGDLFSNAAYPFPRAKMLFVGEIIQRFYLRNGQPAGPYKNRISEIKKFVQNDLREEFSRNGMVKKDDGGKDYCLAEISEFGALQQKAQQYMKPIYALSASELEATGVVLDGLEKNRKRFDVLFAKIGNAIIQAVR